MKKGFTSKELVIVIIFVAIILAVVLPILFNAINNRDKSEMLNYAQLYIKKLNNEIISARIDGEDKLYKVELPKKINETVTFSINSNILENPYNYDGIVKVTYISDSKYEYKIAIHNDKYMIGTKRKPIMESNLNLNIIKEYDSNSFEKK